MHFTVAVLSTLFEPLRQVTFLFHGQGCYQLLTNPTTRCRQNRISGVLIKSTVYIYPLNPSDRVGVMKLEVTLYAKIE